MMDKYQNFLGMFKNSAGHYCSKRTITFLGVMIGYLIAIFVILYGMFGVIASPSVVTTVTISIAGAPFVALAAAIFGRRNKNDNT